MLAGLQKSITAGEMFSTFISFRAYEFLEGAVVDSKGTFIAGSYEGRSVAFDSSGKAEIIPGAGHTGQVSVLPSLH